ncbi:hypothetical protein RO07_25140 [Pandoraea pulmonicola]|uniref:Uncharacterized protein n=1 Tax=Pandoraea pulmonicola TaxID=93221 RepID=A0ABM6FRW8_PANPU|nr:hypothetical protein RO07_25140 [Pandoraea pulmonicola]
MSVERAAFDRNQRGLGVANQQVDGDAVPFVSAPLDETLLPMMGFCPAQLADMRHERVWTIVMTDLKAGTMRHFRLDERRNRIDVGPVNIVTLTIRLQKRDGEVVVADRA